MILQVLAVLIAVIGYFTSPAFMLVGGFLSLTSDLIAFFRRTLLPLIPLAFYAVGFLIAGSWKGILYGAIIGNAFELAVTGGAILVTMWGLSEKRGAREVTEVGKTRTRSLDRVVDAERTTSTAAPAVQCWRCRSQILLSQEVRGQKLNCPSCGQTLTMPR